LYTKLFADAVSEIKSNLKPSFNRPYLWVTVQNALKIRGLYDTGADISCMSEKIFRQIPPQNRPQKLAMAKSPNFCSAGGQPLPVRGLYEFTFNINSKLIRHQCYIIPELNEPLILGIDFIQQHQLWYCPKNKSFAWDDQPNWGQGQLKVCNATVIPPLSVAYIKATIRTESGSLPAQNNLCIATSLAAATRSLLGAPT
jgi:Retroviral aspartyl protease